MFEIGPALREARERRRLGFAQVEAETKIRARYIRALEEEDFSVLPGATYTKGFLRAYAEYLGLDGQLFIDEYNSRHFDPRLEEDVSIYPRPRSRPRQRQRRESNIAMIALAAIVAVSALVFLGLGWAGSGDNTPRGLQPTVPSSSPPPSDRSTTSATTAPTTHARRHRHVAVKRLFTVTIGTGSGCWISARRRTADGPAVVSTRGTDLSNYTMGAGEQVSFRSRVPIFVRLGAPTGVTVSVNGRVVQLPTTSAGALLRIARSGIRPT